MSETVRIISPVDGSVYAERPIASDAESTRRVARARAAQPKWGAVPIAERARYMLAFLDALLAMNDEVVPELAWQMGRPVRYGGEMGGVEERIRAHGGDRRGGAAPYSRRTKAGFRRYDRARAARRRDGDRAVELSLSDRHQHHRARR